MKTRTPGLTQAQVARYTKGLIQGGMQVRRVRVQPDGTVLFDCATGKDGEGNDTEPTPLAAWKAKRAAP